MSLSWRLGQQVSPAQTLGEQFPHVEQAAQEGAQHLVYKTAHGQAITLTDKPTPPWPPTLSSITATASISNPPISAAAHREEAFPCASVTPSRGISPNSVKVRRRDGINPDTNLAVGIYPL